MTLSKTWSALLYSLIGAVFIFRLAPTRQVKWSLLLSLLILIYPIAKTTGAIPEKEIVSNIREFSVDRAQSLEFRFQNENMLLEQALKKPLFGWSGWGRNRVYDAYGKDMTVTDGKWVLEIGLSGIVGFIFYYAILLMPLFLATKNVKYIKDDKQKVYFCALAIILATCIIDSVPNTGMGSIHLLLAGALLGQAELLKKQNLMIK